MSSKHLIIVESPTKAKTISKFLNNDYIIQSSFGHVRDLPVTELGIDVENNFEPKYINIRRNSKNLTALKKYQKQTDNIILATDEDREGRDPAPGVRVYATGQPPARAPLVPRDGHAWVGRVEARRGRQTPHVVG